jgi:UDP-N-acetylmuramate: L-alanyl-gamma-D-glutamyl-meso-diaminopimelate ligase
MKNYHFIAIGGAVMHNLALELLAHGNHITGSDDEIFDPAKSRLEAAGIMPPALGWFPDKLNQHIDAVILGMHARGDNPELLRAQELGLKVYSFPEFIYEHSKDKTRVVIGGSHGKTTSTAMLMHVLKYYNREFDYLVGSQLPGFQRMVRLSDAPLVVIEGDEYLTSALHPVPKFHVYKPHLAMITGVAWDHINVFPTYENYVDQFRIFEKTIVDGGSLFWFESDEDLKQLATEFTCYNRAYTQPDYEQNEEGVTVHVNGKSYPMQFFGKHNLQNANGVAGIASKLGIDADAFWTAMQTFTGTAKRLEKMYQSENLTIFRDFAHAPSKVKATVQAVREQFPDHQFVAVFELHTFSSLRTDFLPGYKGALSPANQAFVLYDPHVYELKKMPIPPKGFIQNTISDCIEFSNPKDLQQAVLEKLNGTKSVLLLMSSGNLGGLTPQDFIQ